MSEFITKVVIAADNQTAPAVNAATKGIQNYAKAATAAQSQVRGASRQSRAALQQLGYQVQDISVQLQAGQSPFVVLAQQGSQVASIFGPGGAVIGALIAVGGAIAGTLLPSLFKTSESLADIKTRAEALGVKFEDIAPVSATANIKELQKQLYATRDEIKAYGVDINEVEADITRLAALPLGALNAPLSASGIETTRKNIELAVIRARELNEEILKGTVMTGAQAQQTALEIQSSFRERQLEQQREINARVQAALGPQAKLNAEYAELNRLLNERKVSELDYLVLLAELDEKQQQLNKSSKIEVKTNKEKVKTYEELVAQFRPALALGLQYQNFVKEITKYGLSEAEVTELKSIAYEDLVNRLKELNNVQEETKRKLETTTEAIDQTPLEAYAASIKTAEQSMQDMAVGGLKSLEDGMANLIAGTGNVKDAFRSMASSIISDLIRMQVQKSITGPLSGLLQGLSLFGGAPMSSAGSTPGVSTVGGPIAPVPSYSGGGYTGSGGRSGGMDGKGGFMAMLHPNETVIDHTNGGGAGVTIVQNINVTTGVQQTVRAEIAQLMPKIAEASKAAVLDARKRGGSYSAAFGG